MLKEIGFSAEEIDDLSREHKFAVDVSDDPAVFTDDNLKQYNALVFSNTNNVVFDTDAQRVALMRYVRPAADSPRFIPPAGRSATRSGSRAARRDVLASRADSEVRRPHPGSTHPSVAHLPERWERDDECYYLVRMNMNLRVLAANDLTTVRDPKEAPATFGDLFPSVWYQEFDGGRQWYTSLGHRKDDYAQPAFRRHLLGGIESVVRTRRATTPRLRGHPADEPRNARTTRP